MENAALDAALEKIRGDLEGAQPELSADEVKALTEFLTAMAAKPDRTAPEDLLCQHIRSVLQARATAARREGQEAPTYQRTNLALRAAIDLCLQAQFERVGQSHLVLLRDTRTTLAEMARAQPPTENQVRLAKLIEQCLLAYAVWCEDNEPVD